MFDHVTIRVENLDDSLRFYELALATLGFGAPSGGDEFFEWEDLSIAGARADRPLTRSLHLALVARSQGDVDGWWREMTGAGYRDHGAPGLRPRYHAAYYGAFVLDPDGNSVEAVWHGRPREGENRIDHLWMRVRDLGASRRFYETVAPTVGLHLAGSRPERFHVRDGDRSFTLVGGTPPTENVHLAFSARDNVTVDEFHRAALAAGFRDNGAPGERPVYHAGYYGAFVLDPDGNNVEAVCHNR